MPPELERLVLGGSPEPWERLGLTAVRDTITLGGVALRFRGGAPGIHAWALHGVPPGDLDGLVCERAEDAVAAVAFEHELAVTAVDHVVALTDDVERTKRALVAAGLDHRRDRDAGDGHTQAFFLVRPTLLELGGPAPDHDGAAFWGLTLVVEDLDAAARRLGDRLGAIKDAVQPGRRIATMRAQAGLGVPLALMTPRR